MMSFIQNQEHMRDYMRNALGGLFPFNQFEEMGKQNMAMMEKAMKMFAPFAREGQAKADAEAAPTAGSGGDKLGELQKQIDALQKQVQDLGRNRRE